MGMRSVDARWFGKRPQQIVVAPKYDELPAAYKRAAGRMLEWLMEQVNRLEYCDDWPSGEAGDSAYEAFPPLLVSGVKETATWTT